MIRCQVTDRRVDHARPRHHYREAVDAAPDGLSVSPVGSPVVVQERTFPGEAASVKLARSFVQEVLDGLDPEAQEVAVLLTSELGSNAVRHAASDFTVAVGVGDDEVRVTVTDHSGGDPIRRSPGPLATSGRGILIVEALAERWGVDPIDGGGKVVWFTLRLDPR